MKFDVVFLDHTTPKYYDSLELRNTAMGGTEATVIRIAEGLASLGLVVGVVQNTGLTFPPTIGASLKDNLFYLDVTWLDKIDTRNLVVLRSIRGLELFPKAKKFIWLHDLVDERVLAWEPEISKHGASIIAVSDWHLGTVKDMLPNVPSLRIYNPVPAELYLPEAKRPPVDANFMAWMSSPHKGLEKALKLMPEVRKHLPKMRLKVFNPGYLKLGFINDGSVQFYGSLPATQMWSEVATCLCVFYPCQFDETFGLVAAEANAMGVPVATFPRAGLKETVSSADQFATDDGELVELVKTWYNDRPKVTGQDRFRIGNVIVEWLKILG